MQPQRSADSQRGIYDKFNVLWAGDRNILGLSIGWHWQDKKSAAITGPFETSEAAHLAAQRAFR